MHRRRFLATALATIGSAGSAGCLGATEQTSNRTATATASPTRGQQSTVSDESSAATADATASETAQSPTALPQTDVQLFHAIRYVRGPDAITIDAPDRAQFGFVRVPLEAAGPPPSAFELHTEAGSYTPEFERPGIELEMPDVPVAYTDENRGGSLVFDIPLIETETAALVTDGVEYPLPSSFAADLGAVPKFTVIDIQAPSAVEPDRIVEIQVTVQNDGDRAGTFLGGIQQSGIPHTFETTVPAGERRTATAVVEAYGEPGSTVVLEVSWLGGTGLVEIPIRTETETTSSLGDAHSAAGRTSSTTVPRGSLSWSRTDPS